MFLWLILAALAFGAVFDGLGAARAIENLFIGELQLEPWHDPHDDDGSLHRAWACSSTTPPCW